jgi:hypothetical protein
MTPRDLQRDLDKEQAAVDLDQGIADREQARVDRDQEPLDAAQEALAAEVPDEHDGTRSHAQRSVNIGLHQDRQDAHQAQIDQTQLAQGVRQDLLDQQQSDLETPIGEDSQELDPDLALAGEELQEALRRRAEETVARAESARQRAVETLQRLEAAQVRQDQRADPRK